MAHSIPPLGITMHEVTFHEHSRRGKGAAYLLAFLSEWLRSRFCVRGGAPLGGGLRGPGGRGVGLLAGGRSVLPQDQLHQVLLLAAQLCGDLVQVQVVSQLLHLELHELGAQERRATTPLAAEAHAGTQGRLHRAAATETLLTVHAHVLPAGGDRERKQISLQDYKHGRGRFGIVLPGLFACSSFIIYAKCVRVISHFA